MPGSPKKGGKGKPGSPKKKSKKEREAAKAAEAARLAEEARVAEEERLRVEEEERRRIAEEQRIAREAEEQRLAEEAARLTLEREGLAEFFGNRSTRHAKAMRQLYEDREWNDFLACSHHPNPRREGELSSYMAVGEAGADDVPGETLAFLADNEQIIDKTIQCLMEAKQDDDDEAAARYQDHIRKLRALGSARLDRCSATILQHSDQYLNDKREVQMAATAGGFKLGMWVNACKNPRVKLIEFPELDVRLELPKVLALANIAVRVVQSGYQPAGITADEYMALGGVFRVDLLALPAPPKTVKGWTLRHVTALTTTVQKLPYPIPPAGADLSAVTSSAASTTIAPPMTVEFVVPDYAIVLEELPEVGWFDEESQTWKTDGISEVQYNASTRVLSCQTIKLTQLALIQSRTRLMPYYSWAIRPTSDASALLTLQTSVCRLEIEVGAGWAAVKAPNYPQLRELIGVPMMPRLLLQRLSIRGLHLLPEDEDAQYVGVAVKDAAVEKSLCADLATMVPSYSIASSVWNRAVGRDAAVVRLLQVEDYEYMHNCDKNRSTRSIHHRAKGNATMVLSEKADEYVENLTSEYHAHLLVTLKDEITPETLARIENADPMWTESVRHMMSALRLFTF